MVKRAITVAIAIFMLVFGSYIYIIFRPSNIKFKQWLNFSAIPHDYQLPNCIINNGPNFLFSLSFFLILFVIWNKNSFEFYIWGFIFIFISIISEILQLFHLLLGTFDLYDILAYILGFLIILPFTLKNRKTLDYDTKNKL